MNKTTYELLKAIGEFGANLYEPLYEFLSAGYGGLGYYRIPKPTYYSALNRLEHKKLIVKKRVGKINTYNLTQAGKNIIKGAIQRKTRTDGKSTIIIFDVPEEKSKQRTIFRRFLIKEGYTMLQRSVFVSPFEISQNLKDLVNELEIRKNIAAIYGTINHNI